MTPRERFLVGYDAYPFGGAETKVAGSLELRGWLTRQREVVRVPQLRKNHLVAAYSWSPHKAAIKTIIKFLGQDVQCHFLYVHYYRSLFLAKKGK